ncbi:hypothetical protein [Thalassotalea fusca]
MLTGRFNAIIISIVIHVLILMFLAKTTIVPSLSTDEKPVPLNSYIYSPPPRIEPEPQPEQQPDSEIEPNTTPQDVADSTVSSIQPPKPSMTQDEIISSDQSNEPVTHEVAVESTPQIESTSQQPVKESNANANAWQMLEALNEEQDKAYFQSQEYNRTRPNTGSVMHGEPTFVPHSVVRPTQEEIINSRSQDVGGGATVVKGDNGSCTITRDLSHVGMAGVTSVEGFRCGLTKQEKAFKAHMAKFRERYGKAK